MVLLDIQMEHGWHVLEHLISGTMFALGTLFTVYNLRQRSQLYSNDLACLPEQVVVYPEKNRQRPIDSNATDTQPQQPHQAQQPNQQPNQQLNQQTKQHTELIASLTARIQEREATQSAMLEMLPDMFLRVREDGTYLEQLSQGDVIPIRPDLDIRGMTIDELLPPAIAESMKYYLQQAVSSQKVQKFEHSFEQNGVVQYEEIRIAPRSPGEVLVAIRDISEQKCAEQTLIESERLNRTLINALPDLIIRMKRDGTYLDVRSPSNFNLVYAAKPGMNVRDVLPEPHAQVRLEVAEEAIQTGEPQTYQFPLQVNEQWQWQEACIVALNDDEVIVVIRDMTIQKNALDQLQHKEAEQEAILSALPDLIFRLRSDGIYLGYVQTNTFTDILPPDFDPVGQHVTQYLPPDHAQRNLNAMGRALETKMPQIYEQEVFADGHIQYEEVRVVASGEDEVLFIIRDISDRKRSEIERNRMKVQLQQQLNRVLLLEQITNEIRSTLNRDRIFQVTVEQVGRAFGVTRCLIHSYVEGTDTSPPRIPFVAEFVDEGYVPFIEFEIPLVGNPHAEKMMRQDQAIASDKVYDDPSLAQSRELCRNIGLKSMLVCRTSYMGQMNGAIGLHQCDRYRTWTPEEVALLEAVASQVGIALYHSHLLEQEIERRNELASKNRDLEKARREAEAANRAKSTFLATMSHELRTPLNIILGFAQVIHSSPILPEEHREDATLIIESGEHLLGLINSVLELSKIEAGVVTLVEQPFNVLRFLRSIALMFSQKVQQKGLQFCLEQSTNIPPVIVGDEGKLRQILINLLNNAIKFTDRGTVSLRVRCTGEGCPRPICPDVDALNTELSRAEHPSVELPRLDQKPVGFCPHAPASPTPMSSMAEASPSLGPNEPTGDRPSSQAKVGIVFEVADTGHGIAPEELEKIFEAFAQTELGQCSPEGTGLGLTISQKFAQLMGSTISVSSKVGEGSCFSLKVTVGIDPGNDPLEAIAPLPSLYNLQESLDEDPTHPAKPPRITIAPTDFHGLCPDWVEQLYDASIRCDGYSAQLLVQQLKQELKEHQGAIAQDLHQLIHSFQFDHIAALIDQSKLDPEKPMPQQQQISQNGITNHTTDPA